MAEMASAKPDMNRSMSQKMKKTFLQVLNLKLLGRPKYTLYCLSMSASYSTKFIFLLLITKLNPSELKLSDSFLILGVGYCLGSLLCNVFDHIPNRFRVPVFIFVQILLNIFVFLIPIFAKMQTGVYYGGLVCFGTFAGILSSMQYILLLNALGENATQLHANAMGMLRTVKGIYALVLQPMIGVIMDNYNAEIAAYSLAAFGWLHYIAYFMGLLILNNTIKK